MGKFNIVNAHVERLVGGPPIKPNDSDALFSLVQEIKECIIVCQGKRMAELNSQHIIRGVFNRLPSAGQIFVFC